MKKRNLLSRAEMKKIVGGVQEVGGGSGFCSAKCEGKADAMCYGSCSATDNVGCTGTDSNGNAKNVACSDVPTNPE